MRNRVRGGILVFLLCGLGVSACAGGKTEVLLINETGVTITSVEVTPSAKVSGVTSFMAKPETAYTIICKDKKGHPFKTEYSPGARSVTIRRGDLANLADAPSHLFCK